MPPSAFHGAQAAARRAAASPPAAQYRWAMPAATWPATCCTSTSWSAVKGAPTPAESYWKIPIPGVQ